MIGEVIAELLGSWVGGSRAAVGDEQIEKWRQRPFLLRWTPIVVGVVLIPLAFLGLVAYLIVAYWPF